MFSNRALLVIACAVCLAGCKEEAKPKADIRPVRSVTVQRSAGGELVALTGQVRAQEEVALAFRLDGRMIERRVNIGDRVTPDQVVARLDTQGQQNALRSAQANLSAAQGQLAQAKNSFDRQQALLSRGFTTQVQFDQAQQGLQSAQAQVDSARAQLNNAQDQLSYTDLKADAAGVVTAKGAEPGEVVRAGQMIVQVARQGGRDAVFDVPAPLIRSAPRNPVVSIALTDDPNVKTTGRVREVAPQADPTTRTFPVKVGLIDPPEAMRLGATVVGRIQLDSVPVIEIPAGALTQSDGQPAVWIVDPAGMTVSMRPIQVLRYDPSSVVVSSGLENGEVVVTAGVQVLRPGQQVRLLASKP